MSKAVFGAVDHHAWGRLMRWTRRKYQGRHRLRWALNEAAKCAARPAAPDYGYYTAARHRRTAGLATLSVARKLARRCYHTLRELGEEALAAASPLAAFAGLAIGLLVLKMIRQQSEASAGQMRAGAAGQTIPWTMGVVPPEGGNEVAGWARDSQIGGAADEYGVPDLRLLRAASIICQDAATRGERLSQRALARQLRAGGHRFPNEHLRLIAQDIGLAPGRAA